MPGNSSPSWNRGPGPEAGVQRDETGLPVRLNAMKSAFHRVREVHLPFGLAFPFIAALAAGTVLRLVAMIGYPGALWFAGDSYVYLGAALRLQPNLSKATGYSL